MAGRKTLPHDPPPWLDPVAEVWFITVCCQPRGINQLADAELWPFLAESIERRNESGTWWVHVFAAMPDHCHALISFPQERVMTKVISEWKRWVATQRNIRWQTDFFDHRLRHDESFDEKSRYILQNPVRAGLIQNAEDWPFVWLPKAAPPFTGLHRP
ncbi:MAG TPA: hypothetical protein VK961_19395 [Chthoniobacter sp.]|nr:hypothetical protein [Chthoniobacter sp.]